MSSSPTMHERRHGDRRERAQLVGLGGDLLARASPTSPATATPTSARRTPGSPAARRAPAGTTASRAGRSRPAAACSTARPSVRAISAPKRDEVGVDARGRGPPTVSMNTSAVTVSARGSCRIARLIAMPPIECPSSRTSRSSNASATASTSAPRRSSEYAPRIVRGVAVAVTAVVERRPPVVRPRASPRGRRSPPWRPRSRGRGAARAPRDRPATTRREADAVVGDHPCRRGRPLHDAQSTARARRTG